MIHINLQKMLFTATGPMPLSVNADIDMGAFVALYGKSGAGKTTLLRLLAGLTLPDQGSVIIDGVTWYNKAEKICLPPRQRAVGMLFQDYALFPNMSVRKNLLFALNRSQPNDIIDELLAIMDLEGLAERKPATLSGGQQQRAALARALVRRPRLLLLDEPLSALDRDMRHRIQDYLLSLHHRFAMTTILVSHDLSEIFRLASRVLIIDAGHITRSGSPPDVFIGKQLSDKFKFEGEILAMEASDVVVIVTIAVGNTPVKVIATAESLQGLQVGDRVIVASKAFNPIILPAEH